jgi:hypothetical protein
MKRLMKSFSALPMRHITGEVKKTVSQAFKLVNEHMKKAPRVKEEVIDLEESMQLLKVSH